MFPRNNNKRASRTAGGNRGGVKKIRGGGDFNMLNALVSFLDEGGGKAVFKARLLLKNDDRAPLTDEEGNEYSREEAAELVKQALLNGHGVNVYYFENSDGSLSGNGRINVNGLTEAAASTPSAKPKKQPAQRRYQDDEQTEEEEFTFDGEED